VIKITHYFGKCISEQICTDNI